MKYYQRYEEIYEAALNAGVDSYNNLPGEAFPTLFNRSLLPDHGQVLDQGCGEGLYSALFAGEGYQVIGVDVSPSAVRWARQRSAAAGLPNLHFQIGDVTNLEMFSPNSFDIVLSLHCYHCLSDPGDRISHLQESYRVLKDGGVFLFDNMAAPQEQDLPDFRTWHNERGGQVIEDSSGVTTTVEATGPYTIQRTAGSEQVQFEINSAVAMAHRFYSQLDHVMEQLSEIGYEILSAEVRPPAPERIPKMKFIHGDNVIYARKPVRS